MPARSWVVTVGAAFGAGTLITLLTGLVNVTPNGLLGAVWYGYPLTWLRRLVIAPQYYPWRVDVPGLVLDVLAWSVVALAVAVFALAFLRRGSRARSRA